MTNPSKSNRLIHSTSPYLLQHASNPVDWFEWNEEALNKAKKEDKPILLSIGYSSCHWCHVMAHQSFENEYIAQLMNEHFVCIKLDREERPDIDQIYVEAVQAMKQNGGWPLNVFLTPDQKPFFGGTYFPPKNWAQLLLQITKAFKEKRNEIESSANDLKNHLGISDLQRFKKLDNNTSISREMLDKMFDTLENRFDFTFGGIEKAPKFVMPSTWLFLARYYQISKNKMALDMLHLTLQKIAAGGIYDQIGGGFARYSVDGEWFAPHFEKMLYDNAQLLSLYAEAYSLTSEKLYRTVVFETVRWLEREMIHPEGGFYSALDADSEGEEGKFYVWTHDEISTLLGSEAAALIDYFDVTPEGNWEHGKNILKRQSEREPNEKLGESINILLGVRNARIKPGLDDKILTGWNAMTIQGLTDAYKAFGDKYFLSMAERAIGFIEANLISENKIYRSYKGRCSATIGFLDDYAFLIQAYTSLYQATFNESYLSKAEHWCEVTLTDFFDPSENYFYFNSNFAEQLIARKKEIFDNVIPSSNAMMARNLYQLGTLLGKSEWRDLAGTMVARLSSLIESEPIYMCHWAVLATEISMPSIEVVIVGTNAEQLRIELAQHYLPFATFAGAINKSELPLLTGREASDEKTKIYVCQNMTCQLPVDSVKAALIQLNTI
jgi:uncharacterized protein YyaL (SSP411 family)